MELDAVLDDGLWNEFSGTDMLDALSAGELSAPELGELVPIPAVPAPAPTGTGLTPRLTGGGEATGTHRRLMKRPRPTTNGAADACGVSGSLPGQPLVQLASSATAIYRGAPGPVRVSPALASVALPVSAGAALTSLAPAHAASLAAMPGALPIVPRSGPALLAAFSAPEGDDVEQTDPGMTYQARKRARMARNRAAAARSREKKKAEESMLRERVGALGKQLHQSQQELAASRAECAALRDQVEFLRGLLLQGVRLPPPPSQMPSALPVTPDRSDPASSTSGSWSATGSTPVGSLSSSSTSPFGYSFGGPATPSPSFALFAVVFVCSLIVHPGTWSHAGVLAGGSRRILSTDGGGAASTPDGGWPTLVALLTHPVLVCALLALLGVLAVRWAQTGVPPWRFRRRPPIPTAGALPELVHGKQRTE